MPVVPSIFLIAGASKTMIHEEQMLLLNLSLSITYKAYTGPFGKLS